MSPTCEKPESASFSAEQPSANSRLTMLGRSVLSCLGPIRSGYDVLRILLAVVLLTAAGLKAHQLATEPVLGTGLLDSRWLLMATVEFELFFGLWLFANIWPTRTWLAALGCFTAFGCVSLWKALSGDASCGCFGMVKVNPWYTSSLDFAVVASLLILRRHFPPLRVGEKGAGCEGDDVSPLSAGRVAPSEYGETFPSSIEGRTSDEDVWRFIRFVLTHRVCAVLLIWGAIGLPAGYAMVSYTGTTLSEAGQIIGNGKMVVFEPEAWVGKRCPLLQHVDRAGQLATGEWSVLVYRYDCRHCRKVISRFGMLAGSDGSPSAARLAFLELPSSADKNRAPASEFRRACLLYRAEEDREWLVETPVAISLRDGIVYEVANRDELLHNLGATEEE